MSRLLGRMGWVRLGLGILAYVEIETVLLLGTEFGLRYAKRTGILSLSCFGRDDEEQLVLLFGALSSRLKSDQVCLKKALMLYALHRRYGPAAAIEFGVKKDDAGYVGHCWITVEGRAIDRLGYEPIRAYG